MPMWHFETGPMVEFANLQNRDLDQLRFFMKLEDDYYSATYKHLREIGVKVPISGTNWRGGGFSTRVHMADQAKLDYIDRHGYWDHPQANGESWTTWNIGTCQFTDLPMVKALIAGQDPAQENNVGNLVLSKAWEQVLGMPMTVSEWNTCLPNEYSLEGTGLMAAYGMLQGWDGPLQFALGGGSFRQALGNSSFDMNGNPPQLLQYPAVMTMWQRHDVAEAPLVAETLYTPEGLFEWAGDHRPLPLAAACVGKVGYRFVDKAREPVVKDISAYWDEKDLTAKSITGELVWNAKEGLVTIDTPGTQGAIGFLSAGPIALKSMDLKTTAPFGALYVTSLEDGKPVAQAGHLLVTAVGQARNTGMEVRALRQHERAVRHAAVAPEGGGRGAHPPARYRGRPDHPQRQRRQAEGVGAGHQRQEAHGGAAEGAGGRRGADHRRRSGGRLLRDSGAVTACRPPRSGAWPALRSSAIA